MDEYLAALGELADAEEFARRFPTTAAVNRVIDARRLADEAFERLSAEARARRPVGIGNWPRYLHQQESKVARADHAEDWRPMSFRGSDN